MTLAGIDEALKNAGVTFDFIGFDACLMATLETGLMLDDYADYLVVCSGRSDRHVDGVATGIDNEVVDMRTCISNEGQANGQWVLLDYGDVVVHIFNGHKRTEYNIEALWKDAPRLDVDIPAELRLTDESYDNPMF